MLVLKCKKDESIIINENIVITVVDDGRSGLALGVTAPKHIPIIRQKLRPKSPSTLTVQKPA